jgi:hypothetical protein
LPPGYPQPGPPPGHPHQGSQPQQGYLPQGHPQQAQQPASGPPGYPPLGFPTQGPPGAQQGPSGFQQGPPQGFQQGPAGFQQGRPYQNPSHQGPPYQNPPPLGFPQPGFPHPGFPQQGAFQPGFPQQGFPPPGFPPPPGYPPGTYPPNTNFGQTGAPAYPPYAASGPYNPNASLEYYFPYQKPPKRGKTLTIIVVSVVVVLLACVGVVGYELPRAMHSSQSAGGSTDQGGAGINGATLDGALATQSAALLSGNEKGWLALVDANDTSAVAAYRRIYLNMRAMHVRAWTQSAPGGAVSLSGVSTPFDIDVSYCLITTDCVDTQATLHVSARAVGGKVRIDHYVPPTANPNTNEPFPWEISTLTAVVGPRVVVAASDAWSWDLKTVLPIAEKAALNADKYAAWGKPTTYTVFLASQSEGKRWFDGDLDDVDGVAYSIEPHDIEIVLMMPTANDARYSGPGRIAAVIQHEMGHAATLQGNIRYTGHDSFVEGIAEYCAYTGHSSWSSYRIDDVRDYIRTGKWSRNVYLTSEITSKDGLTASAAYGIGYLALRYLVQKYGLAKMLVFWGAIERDGYTPTQAALKAFNASWTSLNADCVAYVKHAVGL